MGGARRRRWHLRARARGCERETPRGPGRAVETTDGDHGRGSGRRSRSGSRRRGCRGCGGGLGLGRVPAEGRGPCQQVLGKPGYSVPAGFGASLAGQALQEGGFARARGDRGATRRGLVVAAGLPSLGPPLPPPRAPRGTTKAGLALATPPRAAVGTRRDGPLLLALPNPHTLAWEAPARRLLLCRSSGSWAELQGVCLRSFVSCLRCVNKEHKRLSPA